MAVLVTAALLCLLQVRGGRIADLLQARSALAAQRALCLTAGSDGKRKVLRRPPTMIGSPQAGRGSSVSFESDVAVLHVQLSDIGAF